MYPGKPVVNIALGRVPEGETEVYELLRSSLPDDWIVMHSVRENRGQINYEADFVVLIPHKGILVLEVKAHKKFQIVDGCWQEYHADRDCWVAMEKQTPLEQAFLASKQFVAAREDDGSIERHGKFFTPKLRFNSAAILINIERLDEEAMSCDIAKHRKNLDPAKHYLCGLQNLQEMGASGELTRLFESYFGDGWYSDEFDLAIMDILRREVKPCCLLDADPAFYRMNLERAAQRASVLLEATAESTADVLVSGCAGSGKTVMLVREAKRLYRKACREQSPVRILVLCYNKALAGYLQKLFADCPKRAQQEVRVCSFHTFALEELRASDPSWSDFNAKVKLYGESGVWAALIEQFNEAIFRRATELDGEASLYDHVFIDEVQDFEASWLASLQASRRPAGPELEDRGGRLYYFCDVNQTLYKGRQSLPDAPMKIQLRHNLRNARQIAHFNSRCLMREDLPENVLPIPLETLEGREVQIFDEAEVPSRREQAAKLVRRLIEREGVNPSDIAILSPYKKGHRENSFPAVDGRVRLSTIRSFKGLEADYVILTDCVPRDTEGADSVQSLEDFYVASSRAKFALYILPAPGGKELLESWLKQARQLDEATTNDELPDGW